jgi:hypothetical protein
MEGDVMGYALPQRCNGRAHPHSRCLVHYNPSSTSPALSLVASGQAPVLSQWKEELAKLQQAGAGVAFGYGDFKGKGCVLHYLNDGIA